MDFDNSIESLVEAVQDSVHTVLATMDTKTSRLYDFTPDWVELIAVRLQLEVPKVASMLRSEGFDHSTATEAAQDSVHAVLAAMAKQHIHHPVAYMGVTARNAARRMLRARETPVREVPEVPAGLFRDFPGRPLIVEDPYSTFELMEAIASLPPRAAAIARGFAEGLRTAEIAEECGISQSTVLRERKLLRERLAPLLIDNRDNVPDVPEEEPAAMSANDVDRLHAAIEKLPKRQGGVFRLYLEGCTHAEIAAGLGITASNVMANLSLARKALRMRLGWTDDHLNSARTDIIRPASGTGSLGWTAA
jgi:DNA-directed RNA polymerase specialized sigma24 family protein